MFLHTKSLFTLLLLPLLGSCSYLYDLLAVRIDGRIAFAVDPASEYQPDCLRDVYVSVDGGEPKAEPESGDDEVLVENAGVYWSDYRNIRSCENQFPILYGSRLNGPPARNLGHVSAKPLRRGVVYEIGTGGDGAYGSGWFKILPNGEIINYRSDPTPSVRDGDGYVVVEANTGSD